MTLLVPADAWQDFDSVCPECGGGMELPVDVYDQDDHSNWNKTHKVHTNHISQRAFWSCNTCQAIFECSIYLMLKMRAHYPLAVGEETQ